MSIQSTITGMSAVLSFVAVFAAVSARNHVSEVRAEYEADLDVPMAAAPAEAPEFPEEEHGHGALGEKMNSFARRFAGLWYAGRSGNTALAQYELAEMHEVIEDVQELNKIENGVNLNGVLDALRNTQLKELGAAIQSKDPARFEVAYRDTMKMCNACHTSAAHEFIRIGIPERKPVANRIYEPATD